MNLSLEGNTVYWQAAVATGTVAEQVLRVQANDCRSERTGFHACVSIWLGGARYVYDTFNVGRNPDRQRLIKDFYGMLNGNDMLTSIYPLPQAKHDLDNFCAELRVFWEESRLTEDSWNADDELPPLSFALRPYILDGGATMIFSRPGSLKSYVAITMAALIGAGSTALWQEQPTSLWEPQPGMRPVYFVNLERSALSVKRRLILVCRALGLRGLEHHVTFLNAKGMALAAVATKTSRFVQSNPNAVVFLDSISRAGQGSMVEDDTANRIIDLLHSVAPTWFAIGHTSRASDDHIYGSQMFDAGEDIGIKLVNERRTVPGGQSVGVSLQVVKTNDMSFPPPGYLAFDFLRPYDGADTELVAIRNTEASDFPKLLLAEPKSDEQKLVDYIAEMGLTTATKAATAIGIQRQNASTILAHSSQFVQVSKNKDGAWYGLRDDHD